MLDGSLKPDEGEIFIHGKSVNLESPKAAMLQGITMIPQELDLLPHLSIAENIMFYQLSVGYKQVSWKQLIETASQKLEELGEPFNVKQRVGKLSIAQQQIVAIAKALVSDARIIILDEPTSALGGQDIERFFTVLRKLKNQGISMIFISHRLNEVLEVADCLTVLRDGCNLGTYQKGALTEARLSELIVGRPVSDKYPRVECKQGGEVLRVENLSIGGKLHKVSFVLKEGEVLGIVGALGAGKSELALALFGGIPVVVNGEVLLKGEKISLSCPAKAIAKGFALVPEDRRRMGLIFNKSIRFNITLSSLKWLSRSGFVIGKLEREISTRLVYDLGIKCRDIEQIVEYLSGGNQQKVVIAKGLVARSRVIILDEPTRGIDVGAKVEIYNLINKLKRQGVGVLLLSSDVNELCGVADRILVLIQGRVVREFSRAEASEREIQQLVLSEVKV